MPSVYEHGKWQCLEVGLCSNNFQDTSFWPEQLRLSINLAGHFVSQHSKAFIWPQHDPLLVIILESPSQNRHSKSLIQRGKNGTCFSKFSLTTDFHGRINWQHIYLTPASVETPSKFSSEVLRGCLLQTTTFQLHSTVDHKDLMVQLICTGIFIEVEQF